MNRNGLLINILRNIYYTIVKLRLSFKISFSPSIIKGETYYPEFSNRRKSNLGIWMDQIVNIWKHHAINKFYYLYGFDIKNLKKTTDFVDNEEFMRQRSLMNRKYVEFPPISVLRDKALFGIVAQAYGINTPKNIGLIQNQNIYLFDDNTTIPVLNLSKLREYVKGEDLFIKMIDGECGDGVFHVEIKEGELYIKNKQIDTEVFFDRNKRYLLQESIKTQHHSISAFHAKAINTLRLVTVYNEKDHDYEVFSCVLRIGTGENSVDNWAVGGVSVGVDTKKGVLRKYGFYKPGFGTKVTEHPNSHIVFDGYKIPFMHEAIVKAKAFHRFLYGVHSIGWDIAITENGPCFVEGNDNWEISLMQISNHGLKKEFDRLFK